ncbi:carbohydrate kinase family protein [Laribacter hongkongensis]|uniref:carbohydrate kinase family protein n=1 Tax=Laribacter hongkongensis TaxID=168471 RepID=UPI001EFE26A1|nr:carbohydrate kinase family protein [Laribacter hongkongensis]MCG9052118.1 carbohydrate kinase family protein [Laribacter hongkongensis]
MSIIVCGSLAYDTLLTFPDRFAGHLLPDQLHKLSVCFLVPELRREYGGCAGNIAYNLALLGGEPLIVSAAGEDFGPYRTHLAQHGIRTDGIYEAPGRHTAQCFITSDRDDNQITAFHPGATDCAVDNPVSRHLAGATLAIVGPSGYAADLQHARQLSEHGLPYIFDPGQELPLFSHDELLEMIERAPYLTLNDYEAELMQSRTGLSLAGLADRLEALVITRGPQGSDIWANGYHHRIPVAPAARVVDPTGCGDAYRAGLLFARAQGWNWPLAGRLGALLGAIKIEHQGAQNHGFDWTTLQLRYARAFGEPWPVEAQPAAQT